MKLIRWHADLRSRADDDVALKARLGRNGGSQRTRENPWLRHLPGTHAEDRRGRQGSAAATMKQNIPPAERRPSLNLMVKAQGTGKDIHIKLYRLQSERSGQAGLRRAWTWLA